MGKINAGISSASFASKKAIQRNPAKSGARESGYHLSIYIERKAGAFFRAKKKGNNYDFTVTSPHEKGCDYFFYKPSILVT